MAIIPIEDINYLAKQSSGNINMILSGMTALMNDTDNKVETMESQGWFKRMVKTVSGKNKLTQDEIRKNHDKLNAYMSEAIAELYNRNCIDEKVMMSLGTQLNELYADHVQLKQMLGAFVSKLNEKIDSVDNFHMLTTEINQGVYSFDAPIFSICKIISQFDKRILEDSRKLDIIRRSMVSQNIINNNPVILTDYLNHILQIPVEEIGQIYLELGTIKDNFVSKVILGMIEEYHFLPDMARKFKDKKSFIGEVISNEKLDGTIKISIKDIYDDFVSSKINLKNLLITNNNKEIDSGYKLNNIINSKLDTQNVVEKQSNIQKKSNLQKLDESYNDLDIIRLACEGFILNHDKSKFSNRIDDFLFNFYDHNHNDVDVYLAYYGPGYKFKFAITSKGICHIGVLGSLYSHITFSELSKVSNIYCKDWNIYADDKHIMDCGGVCSIIDDLLEFFCMIKRISCTLEIK